MYKKPNKRYEHSKTIKIKTKETQFNLIRKEKRLGGKPIKFKTKKKKCNHTISEALTVNSPVTASNPTWTVCSKFVGYDIFGLESLCDGLEPFILFLSVFFFLSASSGSKINKRKSFFLFWLI